MSRKLKRENGRKDFWCYACGKKNDHIARNCPKGKEDEKKEGKKEKQASVAVVKRDHIALCMKRNGSKGDSVLDSAASDHMINRRNLFTEFLETKGSIAVGDGAPLKIQGQGKICLHLSEECGGIDVILFDVLYVPELEDNLISIG